ncbi:hypothetical protein GCM10007940_07560 [Portibacter lacus]|uniref:ThuA-like domain-containing protein n=2 Tax=Portibacter lacus TaxID=1099794 RepID=A0AA37SL05_9BACT|nr:hypothetical protein GCM10007940_07560 [Portibacter lacus]
MEKQKLKALIIDGENNHGVFPKTTMMMKDYLEETGLFDVDIARTKYIWQGPHHNKIEGVDSIQQLLTMYPLADGIERTSVKDPVPDPNYQPDFTKYDLVLSNFGWKASTWSDDVKSNFEQFIKNGGGLVVVHAADNSWGSWEAYNEMIGLGGWDNRSEASGPYVYYNENDSLVYDKRVGSAGSHGPQSEFIMQNRAKDHPVMRGLPAEFKHAKDELYEKLRGPAKNMTVLATALSDKKVNEKRTGHYEPVLMAIDYGKGRVFHTILGHMDYSMESVPFITTLQRGSEWAATGKVTQPVPEDFPQNNELVIRKWDR